MLSWNAIRTLCAVLLIIPVLHLAYLVSRDTLTTLDTAPAAWAPEIERLQQLDNRQSLPSAPIVVLGGRRVALWDGLEDWLAPYPVLMRGIGDATVTDLLHYHERLIGYYRPSVVILVPDVSEFHIRDNKSGPELATAIKTLVNTSMAGRRELNFYILPPLQTPRFPADEPRIAEASRLLREWAANTPRVEFLDVNPILSQEDGRPRAQYYHANGIHLNYAGYQRLGALLRQEIVGGLQAPLSG
jgi:hypothetical protein